jgi:ferric-dicitrate binding protein FerR (iron transport regulator)
MRIDDVPSVGYPGWMHGKLWLTRATLDEACREIEARFDVAVSFADADAGGEISGLLDATSAESALNALCALTGKRWSRDGRTYVVR